MTRRTWMGPALTALLTAMVACQPTITAPEDAPIQDLGVGDAQDLGGRQDLAGPSDLSDPVLPDGGIGGTSIAVYLTESGQVTRPDDLTKVSISAIVPKSGD